MRIISKFHFESKTSLYVVLRCFLIIHAMPWMSSHTIWLRFRRP